MKWPILAGVFIFIVSFDVVYLEFVLYDVIGPVLFVADQVDMVEVKRHSILGAEFNENVLSLGYGHIEEMKIVDGLVE